MNDEEPFYQIVEFQCGNCAEYQRRVTLSTKRVRCLRCGTTLRLTDGIVCPGLAKAYPRDRGAA